MSDEKGDVMFFPGPAGEGGDRQVRREKDQPEIEPRRAIDVGARHFRVEGGFVDRAGDGANDQDGKQDDRKFKRSEELKEAVTLPARGRRRRNRHVKEDFPRNQPAFNYRVFGKNVGQRLARAAKLLRVVRRRCNSRGAGWWRSAPR